jgi:hypothetical protein
MNEFSYNVDLSGGSLMVRESRIIANLMIKDASDEEWHDSIHVNNALQKKSLATAGRVTRAVKRRLELLEPEFWLALRDGDDELATQTAMCAMLQRNLLFVEFMEQVVKDAYITQAETLASHQFYDFLDDAGNRDAKLFDWTQQTRDKAARVVFRSLAEAGYLVSTRSKKLQPVVIRPEIKNMLENTFRKRLLASMDTRI